MKKIMLISMILLVMALPLVSANTYWEMHKRPTQQHYDHHSVGYVGSHYSSVTINGVTSYSRESTLVKGCNGEYQSTSLPYYKRYLYPHHYSDPTAPVMQTAPCAAKKSFPSYKDSSRQPCTSCMCA